MLHMNVPTVRIPVAKVATTVAIDSSSILLYIFFILLIDLMEHLFIKQFPLLSPPVSCPLHRYCCLHSLRQSRRPQVQFRRQWASMQLTLCVIISKPLWHLRLEINSQAKRIHRIKLSQKGTTVNCVSSIENLKLVQHCFVEIPLFPKLQKSTIIKQIKKVKNIDKTKVKYSYAA